MSKDNQKVDTEYSLLAGLTENEAYLYGVIDGQKKRIEQLENTPSIETIVEQVLEIAVEKVKEQNRAGIAIWPSHVQLWKSEIVKAINNKYNA